MRPPASGCFFIGTDNYHAGQIGGQRLAKELNGKGNVVVFTIPEQANLKERLRGYRDALEATPGIKITRVVDMKGDSRVAFDTATEILGNDKKEHIDAFVCLEALAGKEVATVLSQHGVKDKIILAMDTDDDTLSWIQKGVIAATISQKPYTMSFVGLKMLDDLYHHKLSTLTNDWAKDSFAPIPAFVDTGSALVDKTNVDALIAASKSVTSNSEINLQLRTKGLRMRKVLLVCFLFSQLTWALDRQPNSDFRMRRQSLASKASGGAVLLFASNEAEGPNDLYGYRPDDNFFYLSGWSEPGAALLIMGAPNAGSANSQITPTPKSCFFPITIPRRRSGLGRSWARTVLTPARLLGSTMSRFSTICARNWSACCRQRRRPSIPTWSPMARFRIQPRLWIG